MRTSALADRFFKLLTNLESAFGQGQGRMVHRAVMEELGMPLLSSQLQGGSRKFVYLAGIPARFLQKYKSWVRSVDVRKQQREKETSRRGRGTKDLEWWSSLSTELTDAALLIFVMILGSVLETVSPYCLLVQRPTLVTSERQQAQQLMLAKLDGLRQLPSDILQFLRFTLFLTPYLLAKDGLATYVWTVSVHRWWRQLPYLSQHLMSLWYKGTFQGEDVLVDLPVKCPVDDEFTTIHGACQCGSRGPRETGVFSDEGQRRHMAWVYLDAHISLRRFRDQGLLPDDCARQMCFGGRTRYLRRLIRLRERSELLGLHAPENPTRPGTSGD